MVSVELSGTSLDLKMTLLFTATCPCGQFSQDTQHPLTLKLLGVVGWCEDAVYLTSPGRPTDIGLQLGKACYPCSG